MDGNEIRYYEFGDFRLDTRRGKLTRGGELVPVTRRNFELLLFLIEHRGQILEHDEILEKVWEGLFVEQSNLKKGISALRQALGDSPDESYFIKTVPRRGYKFDASVRAFPDDDDSNREQMVFARQINAEITIEEEIEDDETGISTAIPENKALSPAQTEKPFTKSRRYKITVAALSILVIVAAAFGAKWYFTPPPVLFSAEKVEITKATSEGNSLGTYVSPDGNYIVYIAAENNERVLQVKHLVTGSVTRLLKLANAGIWTAKFSPDGNYVYYGVENFGDPSASGLYRISFLGGEPRRLFNRPVVHLTFSPDGSRLAFSYEIENLENEIVTIKADGGDEQRLMTYTEELHLDGANWSPDGKSILAAFRKRLSNDKAVSYVSEISIADGSQKIIVPAQEKQISDAVWLPDKSSLLLSLRETNAEIYQIWQYFPAEDDRRRVTNDDNSYRILSLTRDGKTLVSTRESSVSAIWLADNGQNNFRQITGAAGNYDHLAWTRDGRLVCSNSENAMTTVWIMDADGNHKKPLTDGKDGIRLRPETFYDGNNVIFNSTRSGTRQVWRVGLEGEKLTRLTDVETGTYYGAVLSDGQTIIYSTYIKPYGWTIFKQTPDKNSVRLTAESTGLWSISPDEHFIAYISQNERVGKIQVCVRALQNGEIVKCFDFEPSEALRWTRDGKSLAYDALKDNAAQIVIQPFDGSSPKIAASFPSEAILSFDWSYDGTKLAVARGKRLSDAVIIKTETKK